MQHHGASLQEVLVSCVAREYFIIVAQVVENVILAALNSFHSSKR